MAETKKTLEFAPRIGRHTREMISEYNTLDTQIKQTLASGQPMPILLQRQLPKYRTLKASLKRMGYIKG